jgi:RimJ/RimL family protein N-acetyltransferase
MGDAMPSEPHAAKAMNQTHESPMADWLLKADWRSISAYLAANDANSAIDFKARALMRIQMTQGRIDWDQVIGDLSRACELQPDEASHWTNLCQALLDAQRPQEAFDAASRAALLAPTGVGIVEKVMASAVSAARQSEALALMRDLRADVVASGPSVPLAFDQAIEDLEARWWEPVKAGGLQLRPVQHGDEAFLLRLFADRAFMRQYSLFQESSPHAVRAFVKTAQLPPRVSGRLDWVIEDRDGSQVGIAGLAKIDFANRRCEVMFGYPGEGDAAKKFAIAVALLHFTFDRLRLHKVVSHVYSTNPVAQKFTLGLGFRQEGLLREHVRLGPDAGWIDLYVNGLFREDLVETRRTIGTPMRILKGTQDADVAPPAGIEPTSSA